jgi:DHA1 family tetracycline resistance protein-like MFS transporter
MNKKFLLFISKFIIFTDYFGFGCILTILAPMILDKESLFLSKNITFQSKSILFGLLLTVYPLMQFFSAPILGKISDIYGRKKILLLTLAVSFFGYLMGLFAILIANICLYFFSRIISGLFAGNVTVAQALVADLSLDEDKHTNLSFVIASTGLGVLGGSLSSGFIAESFFGFAGVFGAICLMFMLCFFLTLMGVDESKKDKIKIDGAVLKNIINIKQGFDDRSLNKLFTIFLLGSLGINFFIQFASAFLKVKYELKVREIGEFYAFIILGFLFSTLFLSRVLTKKISISNTLLLSLLTLGLILLFMLLSGIDTLPALFIAWGCFNGIFNTSIYPLVSNKCVKEKQGQAFGIMSSINSFCQVVAPIICGFLLSLDPQAPLVASSLIFFFGFVVYIKTRQPS